MQIGTLRERIAHGEDLHTELKEWPVPADKLAAALVAFANADGGLLLLGVTDRGEIVGVADVDAVKRAVDNVAFNNCIPPLTVEQETVEAQTAAGHRAVVVVVRVPQGELRPYATQKANRIFVRTASGRRPASREEILRLYQASGSFYYEEKPLVQLSMADLDLDAFDLYLADTGRLDLHDSRDQLLVNWRLLTAAGHPTIAGMVLFGRQPQRHLPFAQINAARFAGPDLSYDPTDRKDLTGRLFDVIEQAERFVDLHLPLPHEIRGFEPEPRPELPKAALREAIVNSVAHRDYTITGPVRLFIFDDRIEVHTPGKPPSTVDAAAMRVGVHVVRNPAIYTRLADAGLTTRAGTGIPRMNRLVRQATGHEVEITVRDFEVQLTIPRRAPGWEPRAR